QRQRRTLVAAGQALRVCLAVAGRGDAGVSRAPGGRPAWGADAGGGDRAAGHGVVGDQRAFDLAGTAVPPRGPAGRRGVAGVGAVARAAGAERTVQRREQCLAESGPRGLRGPAAAGIAPDARGSAPAFLNVVFM